MFKKICIMILVLAMTHCIGAQSQGGFQGFMERVGSPDAYGGNFVVTHLSKFGGMSGVGPGFDLYAKWDVNPNVYSFAGLGYYSAMRGTFSANKDTTFHLFPSFQVGAGYNLVSAGKVTPSIYGGLAITGMKRDGFEGNKLQFRPALLVGGSVQYQINDRLSLNLGGGFEYLLSGKMPEKNPKASDPIEYDKLFYTAKAGISIALSKSNRVKGDEIEYMFDDDGELALDDLFKEEQAGKYGDDMNQDDALDVLFAVNDEEDALSTLFNNSEESGNTASQVESEDNSLAALFGDNNEENALEELFGDDPVSGMNDSYQQDYAQGNTQDYSNNEISSLMARIGQLKNDMENRSLEIDALSEQARKNERLLASITGRAAGAYAGYDGSFGVQSDANFKATYRGGLERFNGKQYDQAIQVFQGLLASSPDHRLASNCRYWIGESYNAMGNYSAAINAFTDVLKYKKSYKFDDALIMSGLCYMKIGNHDVAREQFQELVSKFPDSEYAPKAMRYLGRL